jgi:uncharacterized protein (TIGR02588 family)
MDNLALIDWVMFTICTLAFGVVMGLIVYDYQRKR